MYFGVLSTVFLLFVEQSHCLRIRTGKQQTLRLHSAQKAVSCPQGFMPPEIPNAVVTQRVNDFGESEVVYRCNRGYVSSAVGDGVSREIVGVCVTSLDGSTTVDRGGASCVVGRCKLDKFLSLKHVTISSGAAIGADIAVDVMVDIACLSGYTVDGRASGASVRQLTCDADTLELGAPAEDCVPVSCGAVIVPPNSLQTSSVATGLRFGDEVSFTCLPGYIYKPASLPSTGSEFSQKCTSSGAMVAVEDPLLMGECDLLTCPNPPPTYAKADMVAKPDDTFDLFSQIQFVCHRGAHFLNQTNVPVVSKSGRSLVPTQTSFRVTCVFDQTANIGVYDTDPAIARCEAPVCPAPPLLSSHLVRKTAEKDRFFVGDLVEYSCPFGGADVSTVCNDSQEWEPVEDACVPQKCSSLAHAPTIANGAGLGWDLGVQLSTNDSVSVQCDSGFVSTLDGTPNIALTCTKKNTLELVGECVRQCGPLPPIPSNSAVTRYDNYSVGDKMNATSLVFRCNPGFSLDGETIAADGANGSQRIACDENFDANTSNLKNCVPIVCGLPIRIPNAQWTSTTKIKQYVASEVVTYTCLANYGLRTDTVFANEFILKCSDYGWTQPDASCEPITCDVTDVPNGAVLNRDLQKLPAGETLSVKCNHGFGTDNVSLTCSSSGQFEGINSVCHPVLCPDLPLTILGASKMSAATALHFGDAPVQYTCDPAWNLPPITVSCLGDKTYDVVGSECIEPKCSNVLPPTLSNTVLMGGILSAPLRAVIKAGCLPGFMTIDRSLEFSIQCLGGTWTPVNLEFVNGCSEPIAQVTPVIVR